LRDAKCCAEAPLYGGERLCAQPVFMREPDQKIPARHLLTVHHSIQRWIKGEALN